jgi:hypothetical protein
MLYVAVLLDNERVNMPPLTAALAEGSPLC